MPRHVGAWVGLAAILIGSAAGLETELCGDAICGTYGNAPRFDDSSRPPSKMALGRATWTFLHVTAAYLPETPNPAQLKSFLMLAKSPAFLYPGEGGLLYKSIIDDAQVKEEMDAIKTKEDAMLLVWKVHNAVTTALQPEGTLFPESMGLKNKRFSIPANSKQQFTLKSLNGVLKKQIIDALKTRWVITGGLENKHWSKRDLLNMPPDRSMLGRASWTFFHTTSVYLPHAPTHAQIESFKGLFDAIYEVYACELCRGHFRLFYHDPLLQKEHAEIATKHDAIMFVWKLHNAVTADGIERGDWKERAMFPTDKTFNESQFLMTSPTADKDQMRMRGCANTSAVLTPSSTCLGKDDHYEIVADVEARWQIEGGIDQPLIDKGPDACDPPKEGEKVLHMDMYVMGKCPWCAKAMEAIADLIKCEYTCELEGKTHTGRLDFNMHMVGLNNGTYEDPWLRAIHGPSELVGERLELCARQHYAKDYQYVKFMHCMDENVSTIPIRAPECAKKHEMDLDLLVACANMQGEQLVAGSYGFASWMGIDITPTFVLNHKKKVLGLPKNFTDIVCQQLASTSTSLAEVSASSGGSGSAGWGSLSQGGQAEDLLVTGLAVGLMTLVVVGAALM
ncbi:hypothetical protein T484DRAFT_2020557, partial [Baffinella frigidus]